METEESYTSIASFLDGDFRPTFGEKPGGWTPSGKRIKRGLYQDSQGHLINADCNGAANILVKVATQLGMNLAEVGRASLNVPKPYRLDCLSQDYRKGCGCAVSTRFGNNNKQSTWFQPVESSKPSCYEAVQINLLLIWHSYYMARSTVR